MLISPRSRNTERRFDEQERDAMGKVGRFQLFTTAMGMCRAANNEEGDIAAKIGGETEKRLAGKLCSEEVIEADERNRCIARSAPKSGAVWNVFFEMDAQVRFETDLGAEKLCCADNQIFVVGGNSRIVAGKLETAFVEQVDLEPVEDADRHDQRIDVMEAVISPPDDAEGQIYLRGGEKEHRSLELTVCPTCAVWMSTWSASSRVWHSEALDDIVADTLRLEMRNLRSRVP
jgi:hypothetical protein